MSMKLIVVMTCTANDLKYINDTVRSLQEGIRVPDEIVVTLQEGIKPPPSLKRKGGVHLQRSAHDYGALTALVGAMERYPKHSDVYLVFLNSNCTYPPHLLQEYETSIGELDRALKQKLPNSEGSVYGLGGVVMVADKKRNLEQEFQALTGDTEDDYETRSVIGYIRENATVDFLESLGSVVIHRSQLNDDFLAYLAKVWPQAPECDDDAPTWTPPVGHELSADIVLSNYFAKHKVLRTQICNLAINRFMLIRGGYLTGHKEPSDSDKRELYERTVKHLRKLGEFYAYDRVVHVSPETGPSKPT